MSVFQSSRSRWLTLLVVLAVMDLAQPLDVEAVRGLLTLPAAVLLPGSALLLAVDASPNTSAIALGGLAVITSLAEWPLAVLVLHVLGFKLTRGSALVLLNGLVVSALILAGLLPHRAGRQSGDAGS